MLWQYGPRAKGEVFRFTRCYECQTCHARLHDYLGWGTLTPCSHKQHRELPSAQLRRRKAPSPLVK